ncbi:MAG: hypothetical protein A2145_01050 [candidate division Zixibacteria bacterium RBG_16_40_9]|nr:MAG: hypothetical protein A2145_01050 [candidate division Zixibacteria bacterium RBG_16_40_9]
MKPKLQFLLILILSLFLNSPLFAQPPDTGDVDDTGIRDSLLVNSFDCSFVVLGYHDEPLSGIKIPLKYKTNQSDIMLDSVRFHPDISGADILDTIIVRNTGEVIFFALWFDSLPAGIDTFFFMFFTPGPTWNPAIYTPIDIFTSPSGSQLSFTTVNAVDITPHYDPPGAFSSGCTDVKDDHRFPSTLKPANFYLSQNFPNPFNTETVITFALPRSSDVKIEIFNILGQKVKDLVDERVSAGYKQVVWDGKDNNANIVASGIYFYRIIADEFVDVRKMTLLK